MSTSFVEIVRLKNGDIALQRQDDPDNPLVTIRFSDEAQQWLQGSDLEIAKIMVEAGAQGINMIQQQKLETLSGDKTARMLH